MGGIFPGVFIFKRLIVFHLCYFLVLESQPYIFGNICGKVVFFSCMMYFWYQRFSLYPPSKDSIVLVCYVVFPVEFSTSLIQFIPWMEIILLVMAALIFWFTCVVRPFHLYEVRSFGFSALHKSGLSTGVSIVPLWTTILGAYQLPVGAPLLWRLLNALLTFIVIPLNYISGLVILPSPQSCYLWWSITDGLINTLHQKRRIN